MKSPHGVRKTLLPGMVDKMEFVEQLNGRQALQPIKNSGHEKYFSAPGYQGREWIKGQTIIP